jgi:hypothetical protein
VEKMSFCNNCKKNLNQASSCGGCKKVFYCKSPGLPRIYITVKGDNASNEQLVMGFCETMIKDCLTGVNSSYIKHTLSLTDDKVTV